MSTSHVIVSETLPTIIGMGVVSKTTDTMFEKKRVSKKKPKGRTKMATRKSATRSAAAKKGWRTRRGKYGKDGHKGPAAAGTRHKKRMRHGDVTAFLYG